MEKALIIFARNPVAGKVKTRLAATIGHEQALAIYKLLLAHTAETTKKVDCNRYVFYADEIGSADVWNDVFFRKQLQQGNDLGERMQLAFTELFLKGYKKVLIIGTDCFDLTAGIVEQAFEALENHEAVIGPSADGGYYLLGMKQLYPFLFIQKAWSTDLVYKATLTDFFNNNITYFTLPVLNDIDTEEDWAQYNITKQ